MRRKLRELVDRVLGMLPTPRPIFDIGPNQRVTITVEPDPNRMPDMVTAGKEPEINRVDLARLLADLDSLLSFIKHQEVTPEVREWGMRVEKSRSAFK